MFRVRMLLNAFYPADDDLFAVLVKTLPAFDFGSGECHFVIVFFIRAFQFRNVILDP